MAKMKVDIVDGEAGNLDGIARRRVACSDSIADFSDTQSRVTFPSQNNTTGGNT